MEEKFIGGQNQLEDTIESFVIDLGAESSEEDNSDFSEDDIEDGNLSGIEEDLLELNVPSKSRGGGVGALALSLRPPSPTRLAQVTPCTVTPAFISPEPESSSLSPVCQWRMAYLRQNHLYNNWRISYFTVDFFKEHYLFKVCFQKIELWDLRTDPATKVAEAWHSIQHFWSVNITLDMVIISDRTQVQKVCDDDRRGMDTKDYQPALPMDRYFIVVAEKILVGVFLPFTGKSLLHVWNLENGVKIREETSPMGMGSRICKEKYDRCSHERSATRVLGRCHSSGLIQTDLFTEWFNHFLQKTHLTVESPVLLILDGHNTHTRNVEIIDLARKNHVTIALMTSLNFLARLTCQTGLIAATGFKVTGIHPCDSTVFKDVDVLPSEPFPQTGTIQNTDVNIQSPNSTTLQVGDNPSCTPIPASQNCRDDGVPDNPFRPSDIDLPEAGPLKQTCCVSPRDIMPISGLKQKIK
ncbi:hypothetical protein J6590_094037 [Homalodisca vitripennis]|nr:hypothetical protein J6590_094037 [Homalodisca vitripennis]